MTWAMSSETRAEWMRRTEAEIHARKVIVRENLAKLEELARIRESLREGE